MRTAGGFTLIELLIALVLSTAITLGLVVAFRLGLQYVEKGERFYASLQETLAVVNVLRRELHVEALTTLKGSAAGLSFFSRAVPDGSGRDGSAELLLRCQDDPEQGLRLEQLPMLLPQAGGEPSPPLGQPGPAGQPGGEKIDLVPDENQKTVLLTGLRRCEFAYLVRDGAPDKKPAAEAAPPGAAQPAAAATAAATPAVGTPEANALPATASWQDAWDKAGRPLALRLRLATSEQELPAIVFPLVN